MSLRLATVLSALLFLSACDHSHHGMERAAKALAELQSLSDASRTYYEAEGSWPQTQEELLAKKLLKKHPKDPWTGKPYFMAFAEDGHPVFYSLGHDQKPGGKRDSTDLTTEEEWTIPPQH